jgi:hypothetical protein
MNSDLKRMIDAQREESFLPDYRAGISDAEALGIVISQHFDWDGHAIMETAISALEDANFHTEAAKIEDMLKADREA